MTDFDPVYFVGKKYSSKIYKYFYSSGYKNDRGLVYHFCISCRKALKFANEILPYCKNKTKIKQLKTIINYYKTKDNK